VLGGAGAGGVETFVRNVCATIDREHFEPHVCIIGAEGPLCDDLRMLDVPFTCLGSHRMGPAATLRFARWQRSVRPHVLHANVGGYRLRWLAKTLAASAVICHVHGPADELAGRFQDRDPELRPWIERTYGRAADLVLTCSDWLRETIGQIAPVLASSCHTLPYGIDAVASPFGPEYRVVARSAHGLPLDVPVIGFVGRFAPQKGIEHLARVADQWLDEERAGHFVAVGGGPLAPALRALQDRHGQRVHLLGPRRDVNAILPGFDLMLLTSRWEAFGIVNLEAMAAGVPVVAFEIDGVPEVIENGTTGLLVPRGDESAMLRAIRELFADPARRAHMGQAGRATVLQRFSLSQMAQRISDHYRWLTNRL